MPSLRETRHTRCHVLLSYAGGTEEIQGDPVVLGAVPSRKALWHIELEIRRRYPTGGYGVEFDTDWYRTEYSSGQIYAVVDCNPDSPGCEAVFDDVTAAEELAARIRVRGRDVGIIELTMGVMDYSRFGIGPRCP